MEEEVLPGGGWRARVTKHDGTVHEIPVLCWVRTIDGMGPVIVLPGDVCATALVTEPADHLLRSREITSVRLDHSGALRARADGSLPRPDLLLPDTGHR